MGIFEFLTSNYYINVAFTAWLLAQVLKTLVTLIVTKEMVWERLVGAGGMPSSHTALVCSLTIAVLKQQGFQSAEFAICLVLAAIVMYDAMGVRRAAGQQAKVLNHIIASMSVNFKVLFEEETKRHRRFFKKKGQEDEIIQVDEEASQKAYDENKALLKELLGHSPVEVLGGAILGFAVALLFPLG